MEGENLHREGMMDQCLERYREVAKKFENLFDWGTASYFYKKCLDISMESKSLKGEALAWLGLGNCEKESFNKYEAMTNFETALQKAQELQDSRLEKEISKELVKVYQIIALEFQDNNDFDEALRFFGKCLTASRSAKNKEQEAECYQKMGHIHEKLGDIVKAIDLLNDFLKICEEEGNDEKRLEAHKELGEAHSKNGNVHAAIKHFEDLRKFAQEKKNRKAQADAFLKLGLLHYQDGLTRKSVEALRRHFGLAKDDQGDEAKDQKLIDAARVNLGIAQANTNIETYKQLVLNDLHGLLDWKIKR